MVKLRGRVASALMALITMTSVCCGASAESTTAPAVKPHARVINVYLDLAVTYATYAKSIWHEADVGGYWGGGAGEKDGNGAVRGTCNTLFGYAMLVHAQDEGKLSPELKERLTSAGLDRAALLDYIKKDLAYLVAHHVSAKPPREPKWGHGWQTSLWAGAMAMGAELVWNELGDELTSGVRQVVASEADRLAAIPPGDYLPGDTKAEENGWDTHALAAAVALDPKNPNVGKWFGVLCDYAANTYSAPNDKTTSDPVSNRVKTQNLFRDFTLENHGFFHPDYVQVSGQELGEAWVILALGDKANRTDFAKRFEPYAMHNVANVWETVMRPLLLPSGEFAFPNGNDWTFHCSMSPAYLAWIATTVDPLAFVAEERAIGAAQNRRSVSPDGRILGGCNLEWWWDPLLVKRCCSAALIHLLKPGPARPAPALGGTLDQGTPAMLFPDAHVWLYRNPSYFVSLAWGKRCMGTFTPVGKSYQKHIYMTLPIMGGICPEGLTTKTVFAVQDDVPVAVIGLKNGNRCALICLPGSALWLSADGFRPIGIENDALTGEERVLRSSQGQTSIYGVCAQAKPMDIESTWINLDDYFGMLVNGGKFHFEPAGKYNQKSVGIDRFSVVGDAAVWQMIPSVSAKETSAASEAMKTSWDGATLRATVKDGSAGPKYSISATLRSKDPGLSLDDAITIKRIDD